MPNSSDEKIQVRITDQAGGKALNATLPANLPISKLLPALITKMQLPSQNTYLVVHKESGKRLADSDTLASAGVRGGDTLRLTPDIVAGGSLTVSSYQDIQLIDAVFQRNRHTFGNPHALFSIFLYTPADAALSSFIRTNFLELHRSSGHRFYYYVVEQPEQEWLPAVRQELVDLLGEESRGFKQVWQRLEASQIRAVENTAIVESIRQQFNVNRSQLPCALFFNRLEGHEVLIVPFDRLLGGPIATVTDGDFLKMFRGLFDIIDRVITKNPREEYLAALEREIGPGPVGVPQRNKVYSTIAMTTLTKTIEVTIATVARLLVGI